MGDMLAETPERLRAEAHRRQLERLLRLPPAERARAQAAEQLRAAMSPEEYTAMCYGCAVEDVHRVHAERMAEAMKQREARP